MACETENTTHEWEMDSLRTRLEISVLVYRCKSCGCLQIKNGGPDAPSVFRPNDPAWNPFKTLPAEPPCRVGAMVPSGA
jgi:hypothetical protein